VSASVGRVALPPASRVVHVPAAPNSPVEPRDSTHTVVSLSGGVASWAAAKRAVERDGPDNVTLLFADTLIEDEDLYRFLNDIETSLGVPITRIADGRTPWEVFADVKFLGNSRVDPCSRILKRELLRSWLDAHHPDGVRVSIGIDWTETHRIGRILEGYLPHRVEFPLIVDRVDKFTVFGELADAGIRRPRLYDLGFPHNNCGGFCVKAGQAQFALLLRTMPDRYAEHEAEEEAMRVRLDRDVAIMRDRRGGVSRPLTMRDFRIRVDGGDRYDADDWGGCVCALTDEPSQLTLDLMVAA
jgi:hypothetical protein